MKTQLTHSIWLHGQEVCRIEHLAEVSGLSIQELQDLVDSGVIEPIDEQDRPMSFALVHVITAKTARRLRDDFELDRHGLALALTLLRRVDQLQAELRELRGRI